MSNTFTKTSLRGFTLIELLVVIAIIGLLSTAIMGPVQTGLKKGRDTRKISDLTQIQGALLQYAGDDNGKYPALLTDLSPTYMSIDNKMYNVTQAGVAGKPAPALRDKFMYVVYKDASTEKNTVSYHLGVALENQNASLQGDADCSIFSNAGTGVIPTGPIDVTIATSTSGAHASRTADEALPVCVQGLGDGSLINSNEDDDGAGAPWASTGFEDFSGAGTQEMTSGICSSALYTCIFDVIPK
jgi:prepilin-type N-terminal cleavage/methylation domain-containing protein